MKSWIYSLLFCICLSVTVFGQEKIKQIESVKVAYITQKMDLTPEESQRFWPVYNNYASELKQLALKKHQERKAMKQKGPVVDEIKFDSERLDLRKRYRMEFSKVLTKEKAALFFQAEREFHQQLIQQLNKRQARN